MRKPDSSLRVAVLAGGSSAERAVSLASGAHAAGLYWTQYSSIWRADLDGNNAVEVVTGLARACGVEGDWGA